MERLQSQTVVDYSATCVFVYESDCVCVGDCVRVWRTPIQEGLMMRWPWLESASPHGYAQ